MSKLRRGLSRALIAAVMVAASGALVVPAATPVGAAGSLRFTGKIVGDLAGTSLLIVATGGQAVRAIPQANGQFAVDVPASILRSFVEDYAGASVQVAKFGFYVGPVSLGAPKVWRLKTKLPSVVDLGTVKISKTGGSATTKSTFTDRKSLRQSPTSAARSSRSVTTSGRVSVVTTTVTERPTCSTGTPTAMASPTGLN